MRIVHIITRLIVGGAQENTLLSCIGQHARGHHVTLLTGPALGPEGSLLDRAMAGGFQVELIDDLRRAILPLKDYRVYRTLKQRLRDLQPDIIHTHSSKAGILARWAAHRAFQSKIKNQKSKIAPAILHTIHGLAFTASTKPYVNYAYKLLERHTAPITDRIICVADAMREQSLAAGIGRREQYLTIYSGMDTAPFLAPPVSREQVRAQLNLQPHHLVVGTIARLFHLKGHDDLLALAPRLCAQFPDLRFLWIGDGILREEFERRMRAMNLRDRFVLTGLVPPAQISELTHAMDILVHPSRREGLARAIVQGQLAGKPVLAYDIDGNREGFLPGQSGYLVAPFDRHALAGHLSRLLGSEPLRQSMGSTGRQFARQRFSTQTMLDALEDLYQNITKAKAIP
jgi:glycosyltransferase involved in cell wall biosynthesis